MIRLTIGATIFVLILIMGGIIAFSIGTRDYYSAMLGGAGLIMLYILNKRLSLVGE